MTDDMIDEVKLRELMNEVAALPREIEPPPGSWEKIRAEINPPARVVHFALWQRPVFLAAAALLLVVGSSAITAIAVGRRSADSGPRVAEARSGQRIAEQPLSRSSLSSKTIICVQ
jgi:hypothetical protein